MHASIRTLEHDGCQLAYRLQGQGEPVLWIQGAGMPGDGWAPQITAFASAWQCLSFDNRGMGASQPLTGRLTIERMAADALALLDAQSWPSAHVIGHSMGGLIAQHLALSAPQRVRSLALLCTFSQGRHATRITWPLVWLGLRSRIGTRRMRRHAFLKFVLPPQLLARENLDLWAEKLGPFFGRDLADQPSVVMTQIGAMRHYDATPRLAELRNIRTLVVSGERDVIAKPEYGRALATAIPGARYVELPKAAHGVPVYQPASINDLLRKHLQS